MCIRDRLETKKLSRDKKGRLDTKSKTEKLSRDKNSCLETMSAAKKLSQDNAFVSDLVLRQHGCSSRDNQNGQRQLKRQPTAVDPAEGKLRKITTQGNPSVFTTPVFTTSSQVSLLATGRRVAGLYGLKQRNRGGL